MYHNLSPKNGKAYLIISPGDLTPKNITQIAVIKKHQKAVCKIILIIAAL
jgi:hypothetical protein